MKHITDTHASHTFLNTSDTLVSFLAGVSSEGAVTVADAVGVDVVVDVDVDVDVDATGVNADVDVVDAAADVDVDADAVVNAGVGTVARRFCMVSSSFCFPCLSCRCLFRCMLTVEYIVG